ncbi:MAG: XVIPCD domain-containing protein, partial [Pseudomonadota bacterium]
FRLNADWQRTPNGQLYGADGAFRLGREGNGTAAFRVDEPNGTSLFNTKLNFDQDFRLNADWQRTPNGQLYGADGAFRLGREGSGTAAFRVDEPNGTSMFNTRLKFDDRFGLDADYTNTKNGAIYGAETTFKLGKNGSGTGGFRVDEPAQTSSINGALSFDSGNTVKFDLNKTPNGSVYGADGSFGIGRDGKGLASFRIDEPNGTSNYKLGASFANGNAFNAQVMADRLGTSLGFDAKVGFDKGAGSVALDGKFGPRAIDLGASLNYANRDLQYSGVVRANNESGAFRLSEFGAKVTTTGSDRYRFTAEAGYRPDTREAYGMVGLTISFGGGSKPSRPITRAEPTFDPVRSVDVAAADFREKQAVLLRPDNRGLYEQAVAGVQKLNADGAKLPVQETAASLTVLAKQNGMREIGYVALGKPTPDGRQNLFIGDGDPSNPATKQAFVDKSQASATPMQDSLRRMANDPVQTSPQQAPTQGTQTQEQPVLAAPKRAAS